MAEEHDGPGRHHRPDRYLTSAVFAAVGIIATQLATENAPDSLAKWVLLIGGAMLGGIGATAALNALLDRAAEVWRWFRDHATVRVLLLPALATAVAAGLALGASQFVPVAVAEARIRLHGCPHPTELRILTSPERAETVTALVDTYEEWSAARGRGCQSSRGYVSVASPERARDALLVGWLLEDLRDIGPRPDVWLPDSSLEVDRVTGAAWRNRVTVPIAERWSVAHTPLVLGVPAPRAPAEPDTEHTWAEVFDRYAADGGVVRPDPGTSVTGELAAVALDASTGRRTPSGPDPVTGRRIERQIERTLDRDAYPPGDTAALLCRHRLLASPRAAVMLTEQALVRHNRGERPTAGCAAPVPVPSTHRLVAVYPTDTVSLDHPYVRLRWPGVAPAQDAAVRAFGSWLKGSDGKRALVGLGLRPPAPFDGAGPLTEENGARSAAVFSRATPLPAVADAALARHAAAHRRGRVLLTVDASGSMATPAPLGRRGGSRFQVAAAAVRAALDQLGGRDEVGVGVFPSGDLASRQLVPVDRGDAPVGRRKRQDAIGDALSRVTPAGGTPLFQAIVAGAAVVGPPDADRVTALIVLTDGEDTAGGHTADQVAEAARARGVRVFVVTVGEARCAARALRTIAHGTGGGCVDADFGTLDEQLTTLFGALWGGPA